MRRKLVLHFYLSTIQYRPLALCHLSRQHINKNDGITLQTTYCIVNLVWDFPNDYWNHSLLCVREFEKCNKDPWKLLALCCWSCSSSPNSICLVPNEKVKKTLEKSGIYSFSTLVRSPVSNLTHLSTQNMIMFMKVHMSLWFTHKGVRSIANLIQSSRKFWLTCEVLGHRSAKRPAALCDLRPWDHLFLLSSGSQPPATCVSGKQMSFICLHQ